MARELLEVLEDIAAGQKALLAVMRSIQRDLRQGGPVKAVYTVPEAARILGKSAVTVRRMIKDGKLTTNKPTDDPKQARHGIARADLEALVSSRSCTPAPQRPPRAASA